MGLSLLIDSVGCAVAGHSVEKGSIPTEMVTDWGGAEQVTVVGTGVKVPVPSACLADGELINALDFDAILAPGHVTPFVLPPALAYAELVGSSGEDLITAVVLAHEVGCRVGAALDGMRQWGVEGTDGESPLSGASGYGSTIFGAVAGAASLLGMDVDQTINLFGIAGYAAPVPGLTKFVTAPNSFHVKYTSAGQLTQAAAVSVELAQRGFKGDPVVLDGEHGFWRMFASQSCDWDFMLGGFGSEWRILRSELKPFPSFRMSHDALAALREMMTEQGIAPESVTRIRTTADPLCMSDCYMNPRVEDHTTAQLSWPHLLAAAAYYEEPTAWQRDAIGDPRVRELADRVEIVAIGRARDIEAQLSSASDVDRAFPAWLKSTVTVEAGGSVYEQAAAPATKGHPDNPLTTDERDNKYLANVGSILGSEAAAISLARLKNPTRYDIRDVLEVLQPYPAVVTTES